MSFSEGFFKTNIDSIFIAYSFVYVQDAINALNSSPETIEAVIVQPYRKDQTFPSTERATDLYKTLKNGQGIPIANTSEESST